MRLQRSELELEVLFRRMHEEEIDLQPDFQRGEIWDQRRRQKLIDTVLRQWYVPAVHLVRDDAVGKDLVLDGQQRCMSIRQFFENELAVWGESDPFD